MFFPLSSGQRIPYLLLSHDFCSKTHCAITFSTAMTNFRLQTTTHFPMNTPYSPPRASLFSPENSSFRYEKLLRSGSIQKPPKKEAVFVLKVAIFLPIAPEASLFFFVLFQLFFYHRIFLWFFRSGSGSSLFKFLHASCGIQYFFITGVKWMARAADFNSDLFQGGSHLKFCATRAFCFCLYMVLRVDIFFMALM